MDSTLRIEDFEPVRTETDREAMRRGYVFDRKRANRPVKFIESYLILTAGPFAGKPFRLLDWEREVLWQVFGWVHGETGVRRFREVLIVIPKKNGKTGLLAALILYLLRMDGEARPDIRLVAVDRTQASILHTEAAEHVKHSPRIEDEFECKEYYLTIECEKTGGYAKVCSAEVDNKDGGNLSAVIFDELHLFTGKRRDAWTVFNGAGATRAQPLQLAISTAGHDRTSVLFEQVQRAWRQEDGDPKARDDVHFYGKVYGPRDTDEVDPHDESNWYKYNPSLGHTITYESFKADYLKAKNSPGDFEDWKQRRLNIWGQPARKFIDVLAWDACPPQRTPEEIVASGDPWYSGWDLASVRDLTAWVDVCGTLKDGIDVFCKVWLPRRTAEERSRRDGVSYMRWAEEGWIELVDEDVLDDARVLRHAHDRFAATKFKSAYGDFYGARKFSAGLEASSIPYKIIHQTTGALGGATKELDRLVAGRLLRHKTPDGRPNPVLSWAIANAVTIKDAYGNIRIDRDRSADKIDPAAALVNAIAGLIDRMVEDAKAPKPITSGRIIW